MPYAPPCLGRGQVGMVDLREHPKLIAIINEALNYGAIVELKLERKGLTVVEISRKLKAIEDDKLMPRK